MDVRSLKARLTSILAKYKGEHDKFFRELDQEFDECSSVDNVWTKLNKYWDYMNWTLLESFVRRLRDPSLREAMDSFKASLKAFQKRTHLCDFAKCLPPERSLVVRPHLKKFVLNLKLDWKVCTLEDLDNLKGHIIRKFNIPDFCFILEKVKIGSLVVTWALPNALAKRLKTDFENTDLSEFYKEHGISSITIDGELCKYSAIRHFSAYLRICTPASRGKIFLHSIWQQ